MPSWEQQYTIIPAAAKIKISSNRKFGVTYSKKSNFDPIQQLGIVDNCQETRDPLGSQPTSHHHHHLIACIQIKLGGAKRC